MARKFCVITLEQHYSPENGSSLYWYLNRRVLVGKQESIDYVSNYFNENIMGSFEIRRVVQKLK
jgi:hypothetical protein